MPMIVEDGSVVVGANSYVSLAYADDYFARHPFYSDNWDELDAERKEGLLRASSTALDVMMNWRGSAVDATQSLRWPRYGVVDLDGRYFSQNGIPDLVMQAVCEMAIYLSRADSNMDAPSASGGLEELRLDVLQLKFGSSAPAAPVPMAALRLLRGLGAPYYGSRVRKVQVDLS